MEKVEIMSPVGNFAALAAAIQAKTDSVYFGVKQLNMRTQGADNFTISDLTKISKICRKNNIKSYLTVNSIIYDKEINQMHKIIDAAKKANIDAVIASDISVIEYVYSKKIPVHASTQLNVSNLQAVKFFAKYCDVIVLARELNLEQIKNIIQEIKKQKIKGPSGKLLKIELFCHGALCVSIAGKCYMSLATFNFSANRGKCLQNCRRSYKVIDEDTENELKIENKYIMSPKDLCTISFLDKIIISGVSILKIEGRARPPEYVFTTTKVYKEAVESIQSKTYTKDKISEWIKELETVFNRGFWQGGYYLGKKLGEWSSVKGSNATVKKIQIGTVKHYFPKPKIAQLDVIKPGIKAGDELLITGNKTGVLKIKVREIYNNGKPAKGKSFGGKLTIPIKEKVRENDKVFLTSKID